MTDRTESQLMALPNGTGFSPEFVADFRRRVGFQGLVILAALRDVPGRYDPILASGAKPDVTYDGPNRIAAAVRMAIAETAAGRTLDPERIEGIWRPLVAAALEPGLGRLRCELLDRDETRAAFAIQCQPGRMETLGRPEAAFWREVKAVEYEPAYADGRPATPTVRMADSFDSYAHAIGQIILRLSRDHPSLVIAIEHCEDSLHELLTQP